MDPTPKKSLAVPLVLMGAVAGTVAMPMIFGGTDVQRNKYSSREACVEDYSETQCKQDVPVNGTPGAFLFYGPWYRSNYQGRAGDPSDPGEGHYYSRTGTSGFASERGAAPMGVETGSRGGFGSHGVSARS